MASIRFDTIYLILDLIQKNEVWALIYLDSMVNTITFRYALKLGLKVYFINVRAKKIDDSTFTMLKMVLDSF